ncbi:hypothetical protein E3N88_09373 [Mikania micrantha]|uniref:Uncharacterized protein n=1 Tax=Mikania micrantha TaxID=192012 RepID=A0A5N6PJR6_9ASTR|nr:hypothetical protein E3N88_09373 [Mikania micrantha]
MRVEDDVTPPWSGIGDDPHCLGRHWAHPGRHLKGHLESRTPPSLCRRHPKRHSGVWDATGLSTDATQDATSCWNGYEWGG